MKIFAQQTTGLEHTSQKNSMKWSKSLPVLALLASFLCASTGFAATFTSRVTGNWNTASTWIKTMTGTISVSNNDTTVTGTGTSFTTELVAGDVIYETGGNLIGTVSSIANNTSLTLTSGAPAARSGSYGKQAVPGSSDNVVVGPTLNSSAFAVTLDVTTTCASLTVNAPSGNGTSQLSIGAFTLTVTGNVAITGGGNSSRFGKIVFTSASGVLDVGGNVMVGNGGANSLNTAVMDLSNGANLASTLKVKGSLSRNTTDGAFTPGTGSTVDFDGTAAQTIDLANFTYAKVQI